MLISVFDNLFLLIAAVLSCNEGALSQAFLYTSIFHAQLCFTPEQRAGTETLDMVAATTQFRRAFLIYFCFISFARTEFAIFSAAALDRNEQYL